MKLNLLAGVAVAAIVTSGAAFAAEPTQGWYIGGELGAHTKSHIGTWSSNTAPDGGRYNFNWATKNDWAGYIKGGYRFTPNWRVEVEGGYRPGKLDSVRGFPRAAGTA